MLLINDCLGLPSFNIVSCIFYGFFLSPHFSHSSTSFLSLHAAAYTLYCWALGFYGTRVDVHQKQVHLHLNGLQAKESPTVSPW